MQQMNAPNAFNNLKTWQMILIFHTPKKPTQLYNDNQACIYWSYNNTSKGLRHIQIKENAVRENIHNKTIKISHVDGKVNIADIFTKEDKDSTHYLAIRDLLLYDIPVCSISSLK